jgi:uncharacterized membrane protein (DUF485 family)
VGGWLARFVVFALYAGLVMLPTFFPTWIRQRICEHSFLLPYQCLSILISGDILSYVYGESQMKA